MNLTSPLRIGTRGSPLALTQAEMVRNTLLGSRIDSQIQVVRTSGDMIVDRPLADLGGKGLFTKELDDALLSGSVDIAVHSMKDVPTLLPPGVEIVAMLPRADARDALLTPTKLSIDQIPHNGTVGTSSLRRSAQLKRIRPDLRIRNLRGNLGTRIEEMVRGEVDAIFLAMAGLHRLNIGHEFAVPLSPHLILPAVGQGAIGIACRSGTELSAQLRQFDDCKTSVCVNCERTVLAIIEGTCTTPIGVHAEPIEGERLSLRTRLGAPDGSYEISAHADGEWDRADKLGKTCGRQLLADPRSSALIGTHADT